MAAASFCRCSLSYFVFLFLLFSHEEALVESKPNALTLLIKKNTKTLQYYTSLELGHRRAHKDVVIDLEGKNLWVNCDNYSSSTYHPIPCNATKCKAANYNGIVRYCAGCDGAPRPGCSNDTCGFDAYNPVNRVVASAGLGEDTLTLKSQYEVPRFPFACGYSFLLERLANGVEGIAGLGRSQVSLPKQLASAFKLPYKFSVCIPSSNKHGFGGVFIGGGVPKDLSSSLITTPLLTNPVLKGNDQPSSPYFIDVKSIRVDGEVIVSLNTSLLTFDQNGFGGTRISSLDPYTILHTSIYKSLVSEFIKKAESWKIKRVKSVAPFGACFSSKTIAKTKTGPAVPAIDLVLANRNKISGTSVCWRIYGGNSMVKVKRDVLCLGFVDGGLEATTSIVLGGLQLEDNLLEFDLASSVLGFSSSLSMRNSTCSNVRASN